MIKHHGRGLMVLCAAVTLGIGIGCSRAAAEPEATAEAPAAVRAAPIVSHPSDGPARALSDIPFEYSWDLQLPSPVHMSWISPVLPELLFVQMKNGQIQAIDTMSGETKWVTRRLPRLVEHTPTAARVRVPSERSGQFNFDERLYVISGDTLFCFDAIYGQLIWRHDIASSGGRGFLPSSSPVFQGSLASQRIFIGDWEGRIQVVTYDEDRQTPYWLWQWNLNAAPLAAPVTANDGLTYVADIEGHLHCFAMDRDKRWSFNTVSRLTAPPLLRGRTAYLGSRANVLHVLNRLSGEEITRMVLPGPVTRQPMAFTSEGDRIYVWTGSGERTTLHSVRALSDTIEYTDVDKFPLEVERMGVSWSFAGVDQLVSSTPNHLYITRPGISDRVIALNRRSGKADWHWNINPDRTRPQGRSTRGGPVEQIVSYQDARDRNRSIFTIDANGYLVAYRLFGQF